MRSQVGKAVGALPRGASCEVFVTPQGATNQCRSASPGLRATNALGIKNVLLTLTAIKYLLFMSN